MKAFCNLGNSRNSEQRNWNFYFTKISQLQFSTILHSRKCDILFHIYLSTQDFIVTFIYIIFENGLWFKKIVKQ